MESGVREGERMGFLRRYRAIILGMILVPVNVYFLLYMEVGFRNVTGGGAGPYPSTISLFANTILFLIVLTVLNGLIGRIAARWLAPRTLTPDPSPSEGRGELRSEDHPPRPSEGEGSGVRVRRLGGGGAYALERGELLVIYVMLTISTAIVSIDYMDVLMPMITYPFRFATPENRWAQIMLPHIPSWISVSDPEVVKGW